MKFNKSRQLALVSAASLAAASLVTACSQFTQTLTVDFVYVASALAAGPNQYGQIDVFEINSESGRMRQIPSSPFPSGGRNPIAEAVSADYGSLFVTNQDDNSIVQFVIGTDGKLYAYSTVNTPGIYPAALAVNKSNLFSVALYQPLPTCSTASPCSGAISVYPLTAATKTTPATLGTPAENTGLNTNYWPLSLPANPTHVIVPTAVNVLASGAYVYVSAYDSTAGGGYLFGFAVGSGGVLTPLPGSPYPAGVQPSALASDASSTYLYTTDSKSAQVLGYNVASGVPSPLTSGVGGSNAFPSGNGPAGIVVDPSYPYAYVTNALDGNLTAYAMHNGALTRLGDYATGLQPGAIGVDPSTNRYLFIANFLSNNVSGFQLNTNDGSLLLSQFSPYPANAQPTAVAAIPHNGTGGGVQP